MLSKPLGILVFRPLPGSALKLHLTRPWRSDAPNEPHAALLEHLHLAIDRHQALHRGPGDPSGTIWAATPWQRPGVVAAAAFSEG